MKVSHRLTVVFAATLTVLAPVVTLPGAAAADDAATAGRSPVWVATYHGPSGNSRAVAEAISPDGATLFVTGSTGESGAAGPYHWATIAYNTATGVAMRPDGSRLFLTGSGFTSTGRQEYQTAALNAATGATLWVQHYTRPHQSTRSGNLAMAVVVSRDGATVYVAGQNPGGSSNSAVIADNAATGALRWTRFSANQASTAA